MALGLKDKKDSGRDSDESRGFGSGRGNQGDSKNDPLEQAYAADNSGYDSSNPASRAKQAPSNPLGQISSSISKVGGKAAGGIQGLAGAELNADLSSGNTSRKLGGEAALGVAAEGAKTAAKTGLYAAAGPTGTAAAAFTAFKATMTKRNSLVGGGILTVGGILTFIFVAFSTTYLINIKERMTGESNRVSNTISVYMQKRRLNSVGKLIQRQAQGKLTSRLVTKLEAEGFAVVLEKNAIKSISREVSGETVELVFSGSNKKLAQQIAELGTKVEGREFIRAFDGVAKEGVARFSGVVTRKNVFQRLGIYSLIDWVGAYLARAGPEVVEATPERALMSQAIQNSDETIRTVTSNITDQAAREALGLGADQADDALLDIGDETIAKADEFRSQVAAANGEEVSALIDGVDVEKEADNIINAANDTAKVLNAGEAITQQGAEDVAAKVGGQIGSKLAANSLQIVAGGLDLTALTREGCRLKGTLQFIKNVRNVLMAAELAKFAIKFYTVADHQKAGLAQSTSIKLMALYFAGSTASGGMQWALTGGKAAVSTAGISKYGIGYADVGFLSAISTFLNNVPGLGSESCQFVNNPLTMVGGTVAGGVVAFFSAGTVTSVKLGWQLGLTVANELAFAIGTPLLLRAVAGLVIDGHESSLEAGDALASGTGAMHTMTAGANAGLPVSNDLFAFQSSEAGLFHEENVAQQNAFERYLNIANADSLLARAAFGAPTSPDGARTTIQSFAAGSFLNSFTNIATTLTPVINTKTYAAGSNQCQDSAVIEYNIAADPFCNPIASYVPVLDLDQTEQTLRNNQYIDASGQPIGEFADFVENCFSGRTGILHPVEVSQEGESEENDPTCVVGKNDELLAGDVPEYFAGSSTTENQNFITKLFSPRVYAQSPPTTRTPTKKERFAAWYGYIVDQQTMTSQINDEYAELGLENVAQVNSNVFVLGDSLTVGMQNLAGTDNGGGNYLQRELQAKGWNATVDAQGCRAVYQTNGPINGDGSSCPRGVIYDGISTVTDPKNAQAVKSAGTFVIALGTNGYELENGTVSNTLFKQKASDLIDKIREQNPAANIYWLNLHFRSETERERSRNQIINELISEKQIRLMDWDTHANKLSANSDYLDDVTYGRFADGSYDNVHHDANGYKIKTSFLVNSLGSPSANINDTTIVTGQPTDNIPCAAGVDRGAVDGYEKGTLTRIRICDVRGVIVNSQISGNIDKLLTEAKAAGLQLGGGGFRSMDSQRSMWQDRCGAGYPETSKWAEPPCEGAQLARPGYSNHQMGFAIDFYCSGELIGNTTGPCFYWLEQNAVRFGLYEWGNDEQLAISPSRGRGGYEPWHWSVNGQ